MRGVLLSCLFVLFTGCAAMELASTGMDIADDVQHSKDVVHKGVVERSTSAGSQSDVWFQDGSHYTVKGDVVFPKGTVLRIYQDGAGYRASTNSLDAGLVASGRVTRIDHRAGSSVIYLENGSSYEVAGDPSIAIGSRAAIDRGPNGYTARQD